MFRLAGENDAESILKFKVQAQFRKRDCRIPNIQGALLEAGAGVLITPSQSLVNAYEPGDVRKDATIMFAGTTLYDGRFYPQQ
jgi:hypothetical protein